MNFDESHIDQFDKYAEDEMRAEERRDFEALLASDPEVKDQFKAFEQAVEAIKIEGIKSEMGDIIAKNSKKTKVRWLVPLAAAASVIIGTFYFLLSNHITTRDVHRVTELQAGLTFYSQGNYEKAILTFEQAGVKSDTLYFYQALSSLSLNKTDDALRGFNRITEKSIFYQQVLWYKGLTYLAKDEANAAKSIFAEIPETSFLYNEASQILDQLNP